MFTSQSHRRVFGSSLYRPADPAAPTHSMAVDGHVLEVGNKSFLIWADEEGQFDVPGRFDTHHPEVAEAWWALSGVFRYAHRGRPTRWALENPDAPTPRTIFGVDTENRHIWLIVFEHANRTLVTQVLAELGVPNAINVDGGGSSCFVIGNAAKGIAPGTYFGGHRPVATTIGIRLRP